jgi:hypothetical protein
MSERGARVKAKKMIHNEPEDDGKDMLQLQIEEQRLNIFNQINRIVKFS